MLPQCPKPCCEFHTAQKHRVTGDSSEQSLPLGSFICMHHCTADGARQTNPHIPFGIPYYHSCIKKCLTSTLSPICYGLGDITCPSFLPCSVPQHLPLLLLQQGGWAQSPALRAPHKVHYIQELCFTTEFCSQEVLFKSVWHCHLYILNHGSLCHVKPYDSWKPPRKSKDEESPQVM